MGEEEERAGEEERKERIFCLFPISVEDKNNNV